MDAILRIFARLRFGAAGAILALTLLAAATATGAPTVLPEPNLNVQARAGIYAVAVQPDGKLLLGGNFSQVNGQPRRWLARLNADGSLDTGFAPELSYAAWRIVVAGNFIYVAGDFATVDGQKRRGAARFALATGALDAWTMDADNSIQTLESDGTYLYFGGRFSTLGGQPHAGLARMLLATGALDPGWTPALTGSSWSVRALAFAGGQVYLGGIFTQVNGAAHVNLARVSAATGAVDPGFAPVPNYLVTSLLAQGGNLYVAGMMNQVDNVNVQGLAKLDLATGAVDPAFHPQLSTTVFEVRADGAELIVAGAAFPPAGRSGWGTGIVRVDAATGAITRRAETDWTGWVYALARNAGTLYAVGEFDSVGGTFTRSILRLDPATLVREPLEPGATAEGEVRVVLPLADGRIAIGGTFSEVGGKHHRNLALLAADGTALHGWTLDSTGNVTALASDGTYLYIAADDMLFGTLGVGMLGRVALADMTPDPSFNPQPDGLVQALAVDNGYLYAGGTFAAIAGSARSRLARLALATGAVDGGWSPEPDGKVSALLTGGTDLIVGGDFARIGGATRAGIARVSMASGQATTGFDARLTSLYGKPGVLALALSGNALYLGGNFDHAAGSEHYGVARVDAGTGAASAAFAPVLSGVAYALAATPAGLYVGYQGNYMNGQLQPALALLDVATGNLDPASIGATVIGTAVGSKVEAIAVTAGKVWFGGVFDHLAGQTRSGIAAWGTLTPSSVTVYEFYAPSLNHYFRTAIPEEAAALAANPALGFNPTGNDFRAYLRSAYPADAKPVCRFYGSMSPGPNSHFYTAEAAECTAVKNLQFVQPTTQPRWNFEEIAFAINLPTAPGVCPAAAPVKVYRAYNNRALQGDSNHRYTTDLAAYNQIVGLGWAGEGVVMCALP